MRVLRSLAVIAALGACGVSSVVRAEQAGLTVHVAPDGTIAPAPPATVPPAAAPTTVPRAAVAPSHPALAPFAPAAGAVPHESTRPGRGTSLDARGSFRSELRVSIEPDGRATFGCVEAGEHAP